MYKVTNKRPVDCLGFTVVSDKVSVRSKMVHTLKVADTVEKLAGIHGWFKYTSIMEMFNKYKRRIDEK